MEILYNSTLLLYEELAPYVMWAQSLLSPLLEFLDAHWPNVYWNVGYMTFLFWMYLFHAPFRVHSRARTDWYAQVTKIMQAWCGISITVFHLAPRYLEKQLYGVKNPGVVFFPLFSVFFLALLMLHRYKRRLGQRITYGSTAALLFLNALLVSLYLTMHYAYCEHDDERSLVAANSGTSFDKTLLQWREDWTDSPKGIVRHTLEWFVDVWIDVAPWRTVTSRSFWFVACPSPFEYSPLLTITHLALLGIAFVYGDYLYKKARGFDTVRGILWCDAVTAASPPVVTSPPQGGGESAVSPVTGRRGARAAPHPDDVHHPIPRSSAVVEDEEAQQPQNPPAMVPWFSSLIARTAFQLFIGNNLNFLSFDFRGVENVISPKIFNIVPTATPEATLVTSKHVCAETPSEDFLWFDWAADVGDGFNSTFEIARLMAQPDITVQRSRTAMILAARQRLSQAVEGVRRRGRTLQKTLKESFSSRSIDELHTDAGNSKPPLSRAPQQKKGFKQPTMRRSVSAEQFPLRRGSSGGSLDVSECEPAVENTKSPTSALLTPSRRTAPSFAPLTSDDDRDEKMRDTRPVYHLPRGSFVLLGGDLAYPSPSDETFEQRLFGPYKDAIGVSSTLRRSMQHHRDGFIRRDPSDGDVATISVLRPEKGIAYLKQRYLRRRSSAVASGATPEEKQQDGSAETDASVTATLRTTPLLFAIPGNHDWIDGLATYRNYILGKSWLGGWLLPQKSSYFVLALPGNWYILCLDTGLFEDIDTEQLAYFMSVIDHRMNEETSVLLVNHEPGWVIDSLRKNEVESQKRIRKICRKLGPRLRMRLCGDIHHYSRHMPLKEGDEAPVLVVSGGGGAFLHGPRNTPVHHQDHPYRRTCAFPQNQTVVSIATRLFGFRIVNWQFDFIGGILYFLIVVSSLPMPLRTPDGMPLIRHDDTPWQFVTSVVALTFRTVAFLALESHFSCLVCAVLSIIFVGIVEDKMPWYKRVPFGLSWAALHILAAVGLLSLMHCLMSYVLESGMAKSGNGQWDSMMEHQMRATLDELANASITSLTRNGFGSTALAVEATQQYVYDSPILVEGIYAVVRCLDVVEGFAYLAQNVIGPTMGTFCPTATRVSILLYFAHAVWFYWILATPVVSFIVGAFLLVSVSVTDTAYDAAYSAFQIEDFKHFLRFRLNCKSRELQCFVIGVDRVPKVWERDPRHTEERQLFRTADVSCEEEDCKNGSTLDFPQGYLPPHLRKYPSKWRPTEKVWHVPGERRYPGPRIIEEFSIQPTPKK